MRRKVGVVGLGAMGRGVATSLLRAGFDVLGFDTNHHAADSFAAYGGTICTSLATLGESADVVIVLVVNSEQTEKVLFGEDGLVGRMRPGGVVVASSTVAPAFAIETGRRLADLGLFMIDAPVSGGVLGAAAGKLTLMTSGSEEAYARCSDVLAAYSAKIYRLGDAHGIGSTIKLLNNLLVGVHIAAASETMALGMRMGVEPRLLYDVITNSAGNSWAFQDRMPHVIAGDFTPVTALNIFVKDLGLVQEMARNANFSAVLAERAFGLFQSAADAGHGADDDTAVIKMYEGARSPA